MILQVDGLPAAGKTRLIEAIKEALHDSYHFNQIGEHTYSVTNVEDSCGS